MAWKGESSGHAAAANARWAGHTKKKKSSKKEAKKPATSKADELAKEEADFVKWEKQRAEFTSRVEGELKSKGSMLLPQKHGEDDWVSVTRSTYPGVKWQVTRWEGNPEKGGAEPTGHVDIKGDAKDVAKELRYWTDTKAPDLKKWAGKKSGG